MSADKQDMSAIAEVPLDTSNPLGMVATLTTIVQDLTRVTIDWTDIGQNGQGILHSLLWNRWRILEGVGGLWLNHRHGHLVRMAIDALQSQECANIIMIGAAVTIGIMYAKKYLCPGPEAQTSFWNFLFVGLSK